MERKHRYLIYAILFAIWADVRSNIMFSEFWVTTLRVVAFVFLSAYLRQAWNDNTKVEKELVR
jgi:hypothetical protein